MPAESQAQRRWAFGVKGEAWARKHHFDNKGKLPEKVEQCDAPTVAVTAIADDAWRELVKFWNEHPDLRKRCAVEYGYDPVDCPEGYWPYGLAEPPHKTVADRVSAHGGVFALYDVLEWEKQELAHTSINKAQARPANLYLRVHGVATHPSGLRAYRMVTRDGHYVGQTLFTKFRARKGDVLHVEASDFMQDEAKNYQWLNPNVVSHYSDAAHSMKELEALAGGTLEKDFAEGPAGDAPVSPDIGNAAAALSPQNAQLGAMAATDGPLMNDVHVDVPLRNISVSYQLGGRRKQMRYQVHKADQMKQLVYGIVLEPDYLDTQDDWMTPDEVQKTAHGYLKKAIRGTSSVVKLQHRQVGFRKTRPSIVPVESFIAPVDFSYDGKEMIKKGSWVMCMHVEDDKLWQDFLNGKYTGFSVGGTGIRQSINSMADLTGGDMMPPGANRYADDLSRMMTPGR